MTAELSRSNRIVSIDLLRGTVMIIMALDHVRDYFHDDAFVFAPTDLSQTTPLLFFTRFITHYCAPVFVLLAGTSAFFTGRKRDHKSLSLWLITRGLWLIVLELTLVKFGWMFNLSFNTVVLQVIWALGVSMLALAAFIHLPRWLSLGLAAALVDGHNLLDHLHATAGSSWEVVWIFLHESAATHFLGTTVIFAYHGSD